MYRGSQTEKMDAGYTITEAGAPVTVNAGLEKGHYDVPEQPDHNSSGRVRQPHPRANSANKNSTPPSPLRKGVGA